MQCTHSAATAVKSYVDYKLVLDLWTKALLLLVKAADVWLNMPISNTKTVTNLPEMIRRFKFSIYDYSYLTKTATDSKRAQWLGVEISRISSRTCVYASLCIREQRVGAQTETIRPTGVHAACLLNQQLGQVRQGTPNILSADIRAGVNANWSQSVSVIWDTSTPGALV